MNERPFDCLVAWEGRGEPGPAWSREDGGPSERSLEPVPRLRHEQIDAAGSLGRRRNRLVRLAKEPFVCFVPPDAEVTCDDVAAGVRLLREDTHASAAALGGGAPAIEQVTFFGLPWRGARRPALGAPGARRARREILASMGSAAVFRRADLDAIGGYDEDLGDLFAELEVGWRLWLAGGRVHDLRSAEPYGPASGGAGKAAGVGDATGHREVAGVGRTEGPMSEARVRSDELVDAIEVAWRCYDDERARAALAAGVLLAPLLVEPAAAARVVPSVRAAIASSGGVRARVQQTRSRSDVEILHLLGDPLDVPGLEPGILEPLADELSLGALFDRRRKVLVVTGDVVGPGMAGPAIRAWHMAQCLGEEHDVVLATTSERSTGDGEGFRLEIPDTTRFEQLVAWCDVMVLQGFVLLHVPALRRPDKVTVVDVYDILHLEALELSKRASDGSRAQHVGASLHALNDQAALGDFFICASEKQRDYWIGHLSALGRVNAATYGHDPLLRRLIDVVPFGLPPAAPLRSGPGPRTTIPGIGPGDDVVLWAGGIYDWFDPVTLVRAIDRLRTRRPQVRLVFMGTRHPNPEVPEMAMAREARRLARSLGIEGSHVFFNDGWVDYDSRQNWLLDADVGVSTHFDHAETAFAFRTRLLDYLWAGLPVVATSGDAFAEMIAREGLGRVVEPEDVAGLDHALYELLSDDAAAASCRKSIERVRRAFEWPTTLDPLLRFCREPSRAADKVDEPSEAADDGALARFKRRTQTAAALYAEGGAQAVVSAAGQRLRRAARIEGRPGGG